MLLSCLDSKLQSCNCKGERNSYHNRADDGFCRRQMKISRAEDGMWFVLSSSLPHLPVNLPSPLSPKT